MSDCTEELLLMLRLNYIREEFRCANKPAAKIAKSPAQRIAGFNPSSHRRFRWFSKRETTRCPSGRGTPMRSKMDLSIHRLKARSSRFSVNGDCVFKHRPGWQYLRRREREEFYLRALYRFYPPLSQNRSYWRCISWRYKNERFNACPIFKIK